MQCDLMMSCYAWMIASVARVLTVRLAVMEKVALLGAPRKNPKCAHREAVSEVFNVPRIVPCMVVTEPVLRKWNVTMFCL
jgi:hypothetical protein